MAHASEPAAQPSDGWRGRRDHARRTLFGDGSATLSLSVYAPGLRQAPHRHEEPSVALLLCGALEEQCRGVSAPLTLPALGVKPDALAHSNLYGRDGAILLSLAVHDPALWSAAISRPRWGWQAARLELRSMAAAAVAGRVAFEDLIAEVLAAAAATRPNHGPPPSWLGEVRRAIADAPGLPLDALARAAGVHRVHLCRSFRRWYGETVTLFRLRRRTEVALRHILHEGTTAAAASYAAGFADQSHLTRSVRRIVGTNVAGLRSILS